MAVVENRFVCDLSKPVQAQALKGNVFSLDNLGSRLSVLIYDNGQPATISGTITGNCILPDGSTVNVNGSLTTENGGSKAYVDVPQSCLLISGILKIAIKCTSSGVITTLAAIVANVYMTKTDNVITPSQQIISDWNAEISASLATQDAKISSVTGAMSNVFADYRVVEKEIVNKYGNVISVPSLSNAKRSGKIAVSPGDKWDYHGRADYDYVAAMFYSGNSWISYVQTDHAAEDKEITIPDGCDFVIFSSYDSAVFSFIPKSTRQGLIKNVEASVSALNTKVESYNTVLNNEIAANDCDYRIISGEMVGTSGNIVSTGSLSYSKRTGRIAVIPGDTWSYRGRADYSYAAACFYNNDTFVSMVQTGHDTEEMTITVPAGCNNVIFSSYGTTSFSIISNVNSYGKFKSYQEYNDDSIKNIKEAISVSPNLIIYDEIIKTGYLGTTGYVTTSGYCYSAPFYVESGKTYKFNPMTSVFGQNALIYYRLDYQGNVFDRSGRFSTPDENGYVTFTPSFSGYIQVNIGYRGRDEDVVMFCLSSDYPETFVKGEYINTYVNEIKGSTKNSNPLFGKIALFNGDSICASNTDASGKGAYAGRIASANGMTIYNYAVGGGTITAETGDRHWIVDSIDGMHTAHPVADYIILEGGTNDADIIGSILNGNVPEKFGSFNLTDYSGSYDEETFCGAVEKMFFKAISYWPASKIGFVVAMKMGRSTVGYTKDTWNRRAYFETIMQICNKWGINFINLWDTCYMNPMLTACFDSTMTAQQNIDNGKMYTDGQHPTPTGYDYLAPMIGAWMKTL